MGRRQITKKNDQEKSGLEKIKELYYTGEEARTELGMNRNAFAYQVNVVKSIPYQILFGKRWYEKKRINDIATQIYAAILAAQLPSYRFERATMKTLPKELELAERVWSKDTKVFHPYREAMLKANPLMSWYVFDNEFLAASLNAVALNEEGIERFRKGERGWLLGDYTVPIEPGKPLQLVFIDLMTTPLAPMDRRRSYAGVLFSGLARVWETWGQQGIELTMFYANGGTAEGRQILKTAKFREIGQFGSRIIHELSVPDAQLHILSPYKRAFAQWKEIHA